MISGGSPFVAGPQPRNSLAKHAGALYSGLLECPLSTRITKQMDSEAATDRQIGTLPPREITPYIYTHTSPCVS